MDKHKEEEEALPAVVELLHLGTATQCRSMSPRVWTYFTVSETKSEPVLRCAYTKCYELLFKKQKCVKNPFCASQKYSFCTTAFFRPISFIIIIMIIALDPCYLTVFYPELDLDLTSLYCGVSFYNHESYVKSYMF